jgi:uncharacterized protein YqgC (DUF456 family)
MAARCAVASHDACMDIQILWYTLAAILIVAGFVGTVLPAIPGVPLVFAGMLLAAWADGFQHVGLWTLIALGVLTVIAVAVDFLAGLAGAKRVGASKLALFGAAVGTIVGIFFGIPGLLLGPFAGALLGELFAGGTLQRATNVGVGAWIGFLIGSVLKIGVCFAMLGIFALAFIAG